MKNKVLGCLYAACFDSNPEVANEAWLLVRFLIERQFIRSVGNNDAFKEEMSTWLQPTEINKRILDNVDLSLVFFEDTDVEEIVLQLLDKFERDPKENRFVPRVLKQAGSRKGVQERMAAMFKKICHNDDATADAILDIIWDAKIRSTLEHDLQECVRLTKNEHWRSNAQDMLKVIEWDRQTGRI